MKRKGKKIFAMFLVLAMLFSMSSVSFADTADGSKTVTYNNVTLRFGDPAYPETEP